MKKKLITKIWQKVCFCTGIESLYLYYTLVLGSDSRRKFQTED